MESLIERLQHSQGETMTDEGLPVKSEDMKVEGN
jgi:D-ribose pyranose/furanose isomerase RbsD